MSPSNVANCIYLMALFAVPAGAAPARTPPPRELAWADVEPAAVSCFALVDDGQGGTYASPDGGDPLPSVRVLPRKARKAVLGVCEEALQHFGLAFADAARAASTIARAEGREAGTAELRRILLADPRVARLLRKSVEGALREAGMRCADRVPGMAAPRRVAFADFIPYLVRLCFVSFDDVPAKAGENAAFHVCNGTNDLKSIEPLDPDLSEVSLGALYSLAGAEQTHAALRGIVGAQATTACGLTYGKPTREDIEAINTKLQAALSVDAEFLALMRPAVEREAAFADLDCGDCTTP